MVDFPYTVITSTLVVTRQVFDDRGSISSAPIVFRHSEQFQQDEEANDFMEHIELWRDEFPKPNGSFNPFRRVKAPATEERLMEMLDDIHGPDSLWDDNPHGYWEAGDY